MSLLAAQIFFALILAQPGTSKPAGAAAEPCLYLVVPLKGGFGEEITAPGVREAIRAAKTKKASAVVFTLDSPGGKVLDADAIAAVMDKERGELKYYAVVTRAISASIWPLSRCDRIFFAPGAAAGAAVAFHWDPDSGHADVDAKFNAAEAAIVSGAAEAHGQSGAVYRAMMLKEAKLFGWSDAKAEYHLADAAPADAKNVEQIDGETSVLAWSTEQAVKYRFGTLMPSDDPASLGPILGNEGWRSAGDGGPQAMNRWAKEIAAKAKETERAFDAIKKARESVVETAKRIVQQAKTAETSNPEKAVQVYYTGTGQFTPSTQVKWREQTDKAIGDWNLVVTLLNDLQKSEHRASQSVDDFNRARERELQARLVTERSEPLKLEPVDHKLDTGMLLKTANEAINKLNANRMKTRL